MAHLLADETLSCILSDCLSVQDADFAATNSWRSPFATDALSSSTVLLVCKRWLRVATPLLYETVILRSTAQSSALAAVLKAHAAFGRYIRKVRVEGGVGASICKIFKAAPNITDLCLTLDLYADDNVTPMYKSLLDIVAPRRLVLCSTTTGDLNRNKQMTAAIDSLVTCITQWSSLRVVTLPVAVLKDPRIYPAVCAALHLKLVHLPQEKYLGHDPRHFLSQLSERCSASVIRVGWRENDQSMYHSPDPRAELSDEARAKVKFSEPEPEQPEVFIAMPSISSYTPLSNVPEPTRRAIWTRILDLVISHTTGTDSYRITETLKLDGCSDGEIVNAIARLPRGPALQCMTVCKEWKEIVLPLACRNLRIGNMTKAVRFMEWMTTRNDVLDLLAAVRSLRLNSRAEGPSQELANLCAGSFVTRFRNLEVFIGGSIFISPKALRALPTAHLGKLTIKSNRGVYSVPSFPSLRAFHWTIESSTASVEPSSTDAFPSMPALERLVVSGAGAPQILVALSKFSMPTIKSLTFDKTVSGDSALRSFCTAHGASIRTVINHGDADILLVVLSTCPGLTLLSIKNVKLANLARDVRWHMTPHAFLERIECPYFRVGERYIKSKSQEREMQLITKFCEALETTKFPALRTLRVPQGSLWPDRQRDIAHHPLPALAERLLERGIRIVDCSGVGWKPRLALAKRK
ncbi:hypothetical protein AURDEDRAFT_162344 [Auricularia subglabra TFB-10046 SS5]|nr:hypothetical protein AURDEDRAFT_162344 [Auricularia subglabra TFB-10046 SS5]